MYETTTLPRPSKTHATCAWCREHFATIVELIDHVDAGHTSAASRTETNDDRIAA